MVLGNLHQPREIFPQPLCVPPRLLQICEILQNTGTRKLASPLPNAQENVR